MHVLAGPCARRWRRRPPIRTELAGLALTAAAFTAVLFLLVIELVAGFAISPLRAALGVSILPLAALAALLIPGSKRARALAGAVLLTGGAAALAFLPAPTIAWTIIPQVLAGLGMGLALPALSARPRPARDAARNLVARHAGIVLVLVILAPVATARLEAATDQAILQGAALVLDAQIDPLKKLELAPALLDEVDVDRPRAALSEAVDARRAEFAADAAVYDRLGGPARRCRDRRDPGRVPDRVPDRRRARALAAVLFISAWRRPAVWLAVAAAAGCTVVYAVQAGREAPPEVVLAGPMPGAGAARERRDHRRASSSRRSRCSTTPPARPARPARSSRWRCSTSTRARVRGEHGSIRAARPAALTARRLARVWLDVSTGRPCPATLRVDSACEPAASRTLVVAAA